MCTVAENNLESETEWRPVDCEIARLSALLRAQATAMYHDCVYMDVNIREKIQTSARRPTECKGRCESSLQMNGCRICTKRPLVIDDTNELVCLHPAVTGMSCSILAAVSVLTAIHSGLLFQRLTRDRLMPFGWCLSLVGINELFE